jgi:hypothetical protein
LGGWKRSYHNSTQTPDHESKYLTPLSTNAMIPTVGGRRGPNSDHTSNLEWQKNCSRLRQVETTYSLGMAESLRKLSLCVPKTEDDLKQHRTSFTSQPRLASTKKQGTAIHHWQRDKIME